MREPVYDRHGVTVAFLVDRERFMSLNGRAIAWLRGSDVYDYRGNHLGWWDADHLMGHDGGVAAWLRGAALRVIRPIPRIPPIPPVPAIPPIRPIPAIPPIRPIPRRGWSAFSLDEL